MNRTLTTLFPLAASLCIATCPAHVQAAPFTTAATVASAGCASATPLSHVQARIVEKAEQGVVPLRQFVWRTRMVYQLDLLESVAWLDQRRAQLADCEQRSARVDADDVAPQ